MRSNAVGGGGYLYFKLGVGWCSYDASTIFFLISIFCRMEVENRQRLAILEKTPNFQSMALCVCQLMMEAGWWAGGGGGGELL